jgi:hypothetical protein
MANDPLSRAIEATGGTGPFRAALSISPRTLYDWRRRGVPDTRWNDVAAASAGCVTAQELASQRASLLPAHEAA